MIKKIFMIFLFLAFVVGLGLLSLSFKKSDSGVSVSLPPPTIGPFFSTPTSLPSPTLTINPTDIENDLLMIEKDLQKMKKENRQLEPPSFVFDLGVT